MFNRSSNPKFGSLDNPNWTPAEYSNSGWTPVNHYNPFTDTYYNELPQSYIVYTQQNPNEPVIPVRVLPMINTPYTQTVKTETNCNCVSGTPYIENGICKCLNDVDAKEPQVIIDEKGNKTVVPNTVIITEQTDILQTVKDNPLLFGALAVGLVLILTRK